jgi:hypothetical protein
VPALSSSLISPALEQRQGLPAAGHATAAGNALAWPGLAQVPDPRGPRGARPALAPSLLVAMAAVLAGARSLTETGERAADAPAPGPGWP